MTRGELAGRTGCNLETIRYYERIGLMPDPGRTAGGYRQYDAAHERRLRFIARGRALGFSIADLKGLLGLVDRRAVSCAEVRATAESHLGAIRQKIADLRRMERVLRETVESCSGSDVPECPLIDRLSTGGGADARAGPREVRAAGSAPRQRRGHGAWRRR